MAGLLAGLIVLLLGAWFVSGWRDVRRQQADMRDAPARAATEHAAILARELRSALDGLLRREGERPYFHYQNLMHDPQTTAGVNVSQSPLADGSDDELVLGYFQIGADGRATTPTLNDQVPELSAADQLAAHQAFRDLVARDLAPELTPVGRPAAEMTTLSRMESGAVGRQREPQVAAAAVPAGQQKTIQLDPEVFAKNAESNAIYASQALGAPVLPPVLNPVPAPDEPVTITISALDWRTMQLDGRPSLIGVRQVDTPGESLTQGFVVDHVALVRWLSARAGDVLVEIRPDEPGGAVVVSGWALALAPAPETLNAAEAASHAIARGFWMRFAGIGGLSVAVAVLVFALVARSDKLARERSQFAAAAAHELRTPLAGLQLYGDMLADGLGDPDKVRDYGRRMSDDAARLGRVVSNVLEFSELEHGGLAVRAQPGPVGDVLLDIANRLRPGVERAGAALEVDVEADLSAFLDRDALTRIVGNLIDNAEKYSRGSADRTIRLAAAKRDGAVEVSVADRGPGVSDGTKLFHAFARGANGADGPAGLGLGLALSQSLARAMGGDLTYRSRVGGGATFILQLRRA